MVMEMIGGEYTCLNSINGVYIPRKRRNSNSSAKESEPEDEAMLEAARILMAMANGGLCNHEIIRKKKKKKKKAPLKLTKKQTRKKKRKEIELASTPEMPAAMRDRIAEIGGYEIQLVIQKQLQDADLNKNLGRLSLPPQKLKTDFVTEEERKLLNEQEDNEKKRKKKKKGMEVVIMDPKLRERSIWLKKWKIGSGDSYCLMTTWNSFVEEAALTSGDLIQLWSFRKNCFDAQTQSITARLCFAMVNLRVITQISF